MYTPVPGDQSKSFLLFLLPVITNAWMKTLLIMKQYKPRTFQAACLPVCLSLKPCWQVVFLWLPWGEVLGSSEVKEGVRSSHCSTKALKYHSGLDEIPESQNTTTLLVSLITRRYFYLASGPEVPNRQWTSGMIGLGHWSIVRSFLYCFPSVLWLPFLIPKLWLSQSSKKKNNPKFVFTSL